MPTASWLLLEADVQVASGIVSIFLNLLLMYLIIAKSPPQLGSYRWLMLYTSFFEVIYAFVNLFAGPTVHTYGSAFVVIQDMNNFAFSHQTAVLMIVTYCSCFGFSMAIFGGHFIYRYGAVNIDFRQKYLRGARQLLLYIFPFFYGILWGVICWFWYSETPERSNYLRETVMENYRLRIEDCAYISAHFWPTDSQGKMYPDRDSFLGISLMWGILGTSLVSVFYFGINCYRWITDKLGTVEIQSEVSKSLQKQLFNALVIQTLIPVFLMYLPAGMVFIFPMINFDINLKYPFIGLTIAVYPAIDPLPNILIIKSYRHGCVDLLRRMVCWRKKKNHVMQIGQTNKSSLAIAS